MGGDSALLEKTMNGNVRLQQWMWWVKGECVVEILKTGHYPNTVIVKLPNDKQTEIEICELEQAKE
jgi:hypothetical protein